MTSGRLSERLKSGRPLLLDGAMGTELERREVHTYLPLWSAWGLINAPEMVEAIHLDYARAGADILVTNTFRTTRRSLEKAGRDPDEALQLDMVATKLARDAAAMAGTGALIAGSIAPLEDCYSPWLSPDPEVALAEHRVQAQQLAQAGVDFLLIETMPLIAEAEVAAKAGIETGLDVVVGFVLGDDGKLISGESLDLAVDRIAALPINAIVVNCTPREVVSSALDRLRALTELPFGGYANLGIVDDVVGWENDLSVTGDLYSQSAGKWLGSGASLIGGCCGTTPEHIHALRELIDHRELSR